MKQMNNDFIHIIEHMELILHWLNLYKIRFLHEERKQWEERMYN